MNKLLRAGSLLLAVCLLVVWFPVGAWAESALTFQTYYLEEDSSGELAPTINQEPSSEGQLCLPVRGAIQLVFFVDGRRIEQDSVASLDIDVAALKPDPSLPDSYKGYYLAEAGSRVGETEFSVTVDGQTYFLPVSVVVPENGFSSGEALTAESYLDAFTYTETSRTFYYVCPQEIIKSSVSVTLNGTPVSNSMEDEVTFSLMKGGKVLKFQVSESAKEDMKLQLNFTPVGQTGAWSNGIYLVNGGSHLETASLRFDGSGRPSLEEPASWWTLNLSQLQLGTNQVVVLRYGSEQAGYSYVTDLKSTNSDVLNVVRNGTVTVGNEEVPVFELESRSLGSASLTFTAMGSSQTVPFSVVLPQCGVFTSQNRSEETFVSQVNYYDLPAKKELWFLKEGGFTQEETEQFQVMLDDATPLEESLISWVECSTNSQNYDLKVTLPQPEENRNWLNLSLKQGNRYYAAWASVDYSPSTGGVYVEVGGKQYLVGISLDPDTPGAFEINEENSNMGCDTQGEANPSNPRRLFRKIQVVAGEKTEDAQGGYYFVKAPSGVVKLQVTDMALEHLWGDEETFSWSETGDRTSHITSGFSDGTWAPLYFKEGYVGSDLVKVTVQITAGGETTTETVTIQVHTWKYQPSIIDCTDCDTVEKVNQRLQQEWDKVNSQDQIELHLKQGHTYEGTIELPAAKNGSTVNFAIQGNYAKLRGGIDLNGNTIGGIYQIHYLGEGVDTAAVFGGSTSVYNSTFQDYALALDGSWGTINPLNSVFVRNTVAAKVDIETVTNGINGNYWQNNIFLENGTAVQVLSLNSLLSSYYFRVYNSNFIGNTTDFDVSCGGTLYFYKNYFGKKVENKEAAEDPGEYLNQLYDVAFHMGSQFELKDLVTSIAPRVKKDSRTKVVTNPRWKEFVTNGTPSLPEQVGETAMATFAAPMVFGETEANYLTADWDLPTQIVNADAEELQLSGIAFGDNTTEAKVIRLDDDQGQEMGSWTFQKSQTGLTGSFFAGLEIHQEGETVRVSVQGGDVVETLQPTLTIPCGFTAQVTCGGKLVEAVNTQGAVTFPVAAGGEYLLEPASESQTPSGGSSDTGSGVPGSNQPTTSDGVTTVTTQVKPSVSGGTATAQVSGQVADKAVGQALQVAQAAGTAPAVEIELSGTSFSAMEVTLPADSLNKLGEDSRAALTVSSSAGSVTLRGEALTEASGSVKLTLAPVAGTELTSQQQEAAGEAPVFRVSVVCGSTVLEELSQGCVSVALSHQLAQGQKASHVTVWGLDQQGGVTLCRATFQEKQELVTFEPNGTAVYVIAYEPFNDVKGDAWYFRAVDYVYEKGIMAGTSQTKDVFSPSWKLTRAQAVQILYNLEGKPSVTGQASFSDLPQDWSADAISWAEETQVTAGFEDNTFRPQKEITREEFAQMLYNYAKYKGCDLTAQGDLSRFPDGGKIQTWAVTAMRWANGSGLINGHEDGTIDGGGTAIRAQAASILMGFDQKYGQ